MAISISFNGVTYSIPETGDESWGESLTAFFVAIPQGVLQKTGGNFTLTNDINFGPNFGLISKYFTSRSPDPAQTGVLRLAVGDSIGWRDNANLTDLLLGINSSDELIFNGVVITAGGITGLTGDVTATGPGVAVATISPNAVTNAKFRQSAGLSVVGNATDLPHDVDDIIAVSDFMVLRRNGTVLEFGLISGANIDPGAAIPYSKLDLTNSIVNADVNSAAAIAYSKLNLTGQIVNADISPTAAIAYSKLNLTNSIVNADISPTAAIAYSKLNLAGSIVNGDVSPTAAIARDKLAAGTPFRIAANNVSGVLSENAAITASRAVVSDANGQLLASTTTAAEIGFVSGLTSGVQTQLNAKIDKAVLSATGSMIYGSAPSTPANLAPGSSGQILKMIGTLPTWSSFSGGINYISSNPDAEADTSGWLTYLNTASNVPVTGAGGVPNSTWTRTTTAPLRSTASFLWTKSGSANRQGEGVAFAFTLDSADRAKVLAIQFDLVIDSGTFTASNGTTPPLNDGTTTTNAGNSDLEVFIYDVTNAVLIPVSPQVFVSNSATVPATFKGIFQSASNSTSYRLIIHTATAVTNNYAVKFDNFYLGPDTTKALQGPAMTDWVPYTPTFTNFGTVTNVNVSSRRVGDSLEVFGTFTNATPTASIAQMTLGFNGVSGNVTVDATKAPATRILGFGTQDGSAATYFGAYILSAGSTNYINWGVQSSTVGGITPAPGNFVSAGGIKVSINFSVPIVGWASTSQMSNDTDTRVVAASYVGLSSATITTTDIKFLNKTIDTHAAYNPATGIYSVPVSGIYKISVGGIYLTASTSDWGIYINGVVRNSYIGGPTTTGRANFGGTVTVVAGDSISVRSMSGSLTAADTAFGFINFERLSGPATIATTDTIAMKYTTANPQSIPSASIITVVTNWVKDFDTHNAFNPTTGVYTCPAAGKYLINASLGFALNITGVRGCLFGKNGSYYSNGSLIPANVSGGSIGTIVAPGSELISCLAGETLDIRAYQGSAGNLALSGSATDNKITIVRVGN